MNKNSITVSDFHNPNIIRKKGIEALTKGLGSIGMLYFMRQFDTGKGNYTQERKKLLANVTLDDIKQDIKKLQTSKKSY